MTAWEAELGPEPTAALAELVAELSPPAGVVLLRQLALVVSGQWVAMTVHFSEQEQTAPEWVDAATGALVGIVEELDTLTAYLAVHVPSEPSNGKVDRAPAHVPGFCNQLPPDGRFYPCLKAPGHTGEHHGEDPGGGERWEDAPPPPPPADPAYRCVTCSNDASDPHAHEAEHGHWPEYAD